MPALQPLIENYLQGIPILRQTVAGLNRDQVLARPVPGQWSTLEVVCHLADFEPIYADRIKRILAEEEPTLLGADENRFAIALAYQGRDLDEELTIIEHTRRQLARILRPLPDAVLGRTGTHNERGRVTLEQLLTSVTNHLVHHVKFIHQKREAMGLSR